MYCSLLRWNECKLLHTSGPKCHTLRLGSDSARREPWTLEPFERVLDPVHGACLRIAVFATFKALSLRPSHLSTSLPTLLNRRATRQT